MNRIRLNLKRQAGIAWLLLFTIAPMGIVKTFHVHETEKSVTANQHSSGDACKCLICQFQLLPFVEASSFHLAIQEIAQSYERVVPICKIILKALPSYSLRAPPSLLFQ